jgi:hypothetical protein
VSVRRGWGGVSGDDGEIKDFGKNDGVPKDAIILAGMKEG